MIQVHESVIAGRINQSLMHTFERVENTIDITTEVQFLPDEVIEKMEDEAWTCLEYGKPIQAKRILLSIKEAKQEDASFHAALGDCYYQLKEYEEAIHHFEQAAELAPNVPDTYIPLTEILLIIDQPKTAIEYLSENRHILEQSSFAKRAEDLLKFAKNRLASNLGDV